MSLKIDYCSKCETVLLDKSKIDNAFENSSGSSELLNLIENEVSPGVDEAAYVKAAFLKGLALQNTKTDLIQLFKSHTNHILKS